MHGAFPSQPFERILNKAHGARSRDERGVCLLGHKRSGTRNVVKIAWMLLSALSCLCFSFYTRINHPGTTSGLLKIVPVTLAFLFSVLQENNPSRGDFQTAQNRISDLGNRSSRLWRPKIRSREHSNSPKVENEASMLVAAHRPDQNQGVIIHSHRRIV